MKVHPTWTDVVGAVASVVTLVVVVVGAWVAGRQLREMKRATTDQLITRHAQLLTDLSRRWDESPLVEARKAIDALRTKEALRDAILKRSGEEATQYHLLLSVPNFFEDLGILVIEGAIPLKMVELSLRSIVEGTWLLWEPTLTALRKPPGGRDTYYKNFQTLYEMLHASADSPRPA